MKGVSFSSIFISWGLPSDQLEWSVRTSYHRRQVCNQIFDIMMTAGNGSMTSESNSHRKWDTADANY